MTGKNYAKNAF